MKALVAPIKDAAHACGRFGAAGVTSRFHAVMPDEVKAFPALVVRRRRLPTLLPSGGGGTYEGPLEVQLTAVHKKKTAEAADADSDPFGELDAIVKDFAQSLEDEDASYGLGSMDMYEGLFADVDIVCADFSVTCELVLYDALAS